MWFITSTFIWVKVHNQYFHTLISLKAKIDIITNGKSLNRLLHSNQMQAPSAHEIQSSDRPEHFSKKSYNTIN